MFAHNRKMGLQESDGLFPVLLLHQLLHVVIQFFGTLFHGAPVDLSNKSVRSMLSRPELQAIVGFDEHY